MQSHQTKFVKITYPTFRYSIAMNATVKSNSIEINNSAFVVNNSSSVSAKRMASTRSATRQSLVSEYSKQLRFWSPPWPLTLSSIQAFLVNSFILNTYLAKKSKLLDSTFYLDILDNPATEFWFKDQRIGVKKLQNMLEHMKISVGISKRITNHFTRCTISRTLQNGCIDCYDICHLSEYRNTKLLDE